MNKIIINVAVSFFLLHSNFVVSIAAEDVFIYPAEKITGNWQHGHMANRSVVMVNSADVWAEVMLKIPEDGYYQIYASVYHQWKKFCPYISGEVFDAANTKISFSALSRPGWYKNITDEGWFLYALFAEPQLLRQGEAKLKFAIGSWESLWAKKTKPVEGFVGMDYFVLMPVIKREDNSIFLLAPFECEQAGKGNWSVTEFDRDVHAGVARSAKRGEWMEFNFGIPVTSNYAVYVSGRYQTGSNIKVCLSNDKTGYGKNIVSKVDSDKWKFLQLGHYFLKEGKYMARVKNISSKESDVILDYFLFVPISSAERL